MSRTPQLPPGLPPPLRFQNKDSIGAIPSADVDFNKKSDDNLTKRKAEHNKRVLYHYDASSIFRAKNVAVEVAKPAVEVMEIYVNCKLSRSGCIGCSEGIASKTLQNCAMIWGFTWTRRRARMADMSLLESAPTSPFR